MGLHIHTWLSGGSNKKCSIYLPALGLSSHRHHCFGLVSGSLDRNNLYVPSLLWCFEELPQVFPQDTCSWWEWKLHAVGGLPHKLSPSSAATASWCRHTQHCSLEKWQYPGGQIIPSISFSDLYSFRISTSPLCLTSVSNCADIVLCSRELNKMSAGDDSCFIGAAL